MHAGVSPRTKRSSARWTASAKRSGKEPRQKNQRLEISRIYRAYNRLCKMHSPCCMPTIIPDGETCQRKGQNRNHPLPAQTPPATLPEIVTSTPLCLLLSNGKGGSLRRNIRRNLPDRNAGGIRILHIIDHSQRQFRYGVELQKDRSISRIRTVSGSAAPPRHFYRRQ